MKNFWGVTLAIGLMACQAPLSGPDFKPILTFPKKDEGTTIPFVPGGSFDVHVEVEIPDLSNPPRATFELIADSTPTGATITSTVPLFKQEAHGHFARTTTLAWPSGGTRTVRVTVGGQVAEAEAMIDEPKLVMGLGDAANKGLQLEVPVCVESSAFSGQISLQLTNAVTPANAATETADLVSGPCDINAPLLPASTPRITHSKFLARTSSRAFEAKAKLVGTQLEESSSKSLDPISPPQLQLSASPSTLPVNGGVVEITILALMNGIAARNIPVRIEAIPEVDVLPVEAVTDASGTARVSVFVPKEQEGLRVDAIAGGTRSGITLLP